MDETPLFENLADQSAPEWPRGLPRFQAPQRDVIELRVVDLDELVAADDPVCDVWAYVATFSEMCARHSAGGGGGRRRGRGPVRAP